MSPFEEFTTADISATMRDESVVEWLKATYGECEVCGAYRMAHKITETAPDGSTVSYTRLLCSADFRHVIEGRA